MARDSVPAQPSATAPKTFERGARVRAHSGPFLGRIGEVQGVEGNLVKVVFGGISASVPIDDLIAVSEENLRPKLSSSHRKLPK